MLIERFTAENKNCIIRLRVASQEGYTHRARVGNYRIFFAEEEGSLVPKAVKLRRDVDYGKI